MPMISMWIIDIENSLVGNVLDTGHVPDMSLGRGHVLKSQGQNHMAGHIFSFFAKSRVHGMSSE